MPNPLDLAALIAAARSAPAPVRVRESLLVAVMLSVGAIQIALGGQSMGAVVGAALGTVAGSGLLLMRSRWPLTCLVGSAALYLLPSLAPALCTPIIAFTAGRCSRPLWRFWATVLVTILLGVALEVLTTEESDQLTPGLVAVVVVSSALVIGIPALAGVLLGGRRPAVRLLRDRNEFLERSRSLAGAQSRVAERNRIAGEMHDLLGHRLSLISMHAGALELALGKDAPRLTPQAELLRTTAGTALTELRQILGILRVPGALAVDAPEGLGAHTGTCADLADLVEQSRVAGVEVEFAWSGPDLSEADPRIRYAVHRAVREGLTNIHRHASGAHALVEVTSTDDLVRIIIANGPGATGRSGPGTRQGLAGLDERAALLGGSTSSGRTATGGFRLMVELPLRPDAFSLAPGLPEQVAEPPVVLDAEILTLPRLLGTGCLALLLLIPFLFALTALVAGLFVR